MSHPLAYRYSPLNETNSEIRLVTLLPHSSHNSIAISLQHVSLHEVTSPAPPVSWGVPKPEVEYQQMSVVEKLELYYDAVSYTWGHPKPLFPVSVNGRCLMLRENIWRFLAHCLKTGLSMRRLWIDIICINQEDILEKGSQVALMSQIFGHANRVLIWLGKDSEESSMAVDFARYLEDPKQSRGLRLSEFLCNLYRKHQGLDHIPRLRKIREECIRIAMNDYWPRLWIVQEISLARRPYIVMGSGFLCIDDLGAFKAVAEKLRELGGSCSNVTGTAQRDDEWFARLKEYYNPTLVCYFAWFP